MRKRIYDCFIFYNELELLEIRLKELADFVDYFVICEAPFNFRGKPKPLYFQENQSKFSSYMSKIINVVVDDMPVPTEIFDTAEISQREPKFSAMEYHQRNAIRRGLVSTEDNDIIMISDCDEIVRPSTIEQMRSGEGYFLVDMSMYQFFLNMRESEGGWDKVFAYSSYLSNLIPDFNRIRQRPVDVFNNFPEQKTKIQNGGWHFTFLGGQARVEEKLSAYAHTGGWQRKMWDSELLSKQMVELRDVGGGKKLEYCEIDSGFPKVIQSEIQKYVDIGLIKTPVQRIKELETLWRRSDSIERQAEMLKEEIERNQKEIYELRTALSNINATIPSSVTNLLRGSCSFISGWHGGVQSRKAMLQSGETRVEEFMTGNAVVTHTRDSSSKTHDNNCGHYSVFLFKPSLFYTASCWIFVPASFVGQLVELSVGEWQEQEKKRADLTIRNAWQRVSSTGLSPDKVAECHIVLRINCEENHQVFSTCWQLEEGKAPTTYIGTN
jgi:hypothetical protein